MMVSSLSNIWSLGKTLVAKGGMEPVKSSYETTNPIHELFECCKL